MRSGLDISPDVPAGRQLIQGYGDGTFRIAGVVHRGSLIVWPSRVVAWAVAAADGVSIESLDPVLGDAEGTEVLLVGCGGRFLAPPAALRAALRARHLALEWMDTGAACRTFNVLLAEDRRVAAALIAV